MIGIVSHNAGGAEILSSWVKKNFGKQKFIFSLSGPAIKVFKKKIKNIHNKDINYLVKNSKKIITGTSWPLQNEIIAIRLAKKNKVFCASYLDHWVNYKARFIDKRKLFLPDEIWTGDIHAKLIAKKIFKTTKIKYVKNEYFESIKQIVYSKKHKIKKILILSTPIANDAKLKFNDERYFGFTEFDAIDLAIDKIKKKKLTYDKIYIRKHPSEEINKFKDYLKKNIYISHEEDILKDISSSNIIIGFNSMAMILAKIMKKKVYSCIPKGKIKNNLPFKIKDL